MDSQMDSIEPRVITVDDFLALQPASTTNDQNQPTVYQSFKIMARDYDEWSKTRTKKRTFDSFVIDIIYQHNQRNKKIFGFLFLREDNELMAKWEEDDTLEYNRIRTNNFIKTSYPGHTMVEKNKWRKEHLRQMLNLPKDKIIETPKEASRLIKLLAEGTISNYNEADVYTKVKLQKDQLPTYVSSVCLNHLQNIIPDEYELETFSIVCTTKRKREYLE